MTLAYCDTSALAKLFVVETGSAEMRALADSGSEHLIALLEVTRVELHSAIRRRERRGEVPQGTTERARAILEQYLAESYLTQGVTRGVLDRACGLIDRHPLTGYDALQLGGAIELASQRSERAVTFVSADRALLRAASAEGLETFNPNLAGGDR